MSYQGKIDFWEEQLKYSIAGEGRYSIARAHGSVLHFKSKQEALGRTRSAEVFIP